MSIRQLPKVIQDAVLAFGVPMEQALRVVNESLVLPEPVPKNGVVEAFRNVQNKPELAFGFLTLAAKELTREDWIEILFLNSEDSVIRLCEKTFKMNQIIILMSKKATKIHPIFYKREEWFGYYLLYAEKVSYLEALAGMPSHSYLETAERMGANRFLGPVDELEIIDQKYRNETVLLSQAVIISARNPSHVKELLSLGAELDPEGVVLISSFNGGDPLLVLSHWSSYKIDSKVLERLLFFMRNYYFDSEGPPGNKTFPFELVKQSNKILSKDREAIIHLLCRLLDQASEFDFPIQKCPVKCIVCQNQPSDRMIRRCFNKDDNGHIICFYCFDPSKDFCRECNNEDKPTCLVELVKE
jgi:hypothetical protein